MVAVMRGLRCASPKRAGLREEILQREFDVALLGLDGRPQAGQVQFDDFTAAGLARDRHHVADFQPADRAYPLIELLGSLLLLVEASVIFSLNEGRLAASGLGG